MVGEAVGARGASLVGTSIALFLDRAPLTADKAHTGRGVRHVPPGVKPTGTTHLDYVHRVGRGRLALGRSLGKHSGASVARK